MLAVATYKTRDRRDVKIVAIEDGIAIGYIVAEGVAAVRTWQANNGRYLLDCEDNHSNDLIYAKPQNNSTKISLAL